MKRDDILDIVTLIFIILYAIFFIGVIGFIVSNRNNEFNRIWRTRTMIVTTALIFTIAIGIGNLHWFTRQVGNSHQCSIGCSILSFIHSGFLFPFFIAFVTSLIQAATSVKTLKSGKPNRFICSKTVIYTSIPILISLLELFLAVFKDDIPFFTTYDLDEQVCTTSSYISTIDLILCIIMMILMFKANDFFNKTGLNNVHQQRVKIFPFLIIPMMVLSVLSIITPFIGGVGLIALKYILFLLFPGSTIPYIAVLIIIPIYEAGEEFLPRGSITKRHGKYLIEEPTIEMP